MTKKIFQTMLCGIFLLTAVTISPVWAQSSSSDVDRQTILNNFTDFFATVGKTEHEKKRIIRKRKKWRRKYRLEKERIKKDAATKRQMKKQQKIIMDKINAKNQN